MNVMEVNTIKIKRISCKERDYLNGNEKNLNQLI